MTFVGKRKVDANRHYSRLESCRSLHDYGSHHFICYIVKNLDNHTRYHVGCDYVYGEFVCEAPLCKI